MTRFNNRTLAILWSAILATVVGLASRAFASPQVSSTGPESIEDLYAEFFQVPLDFSTHLGLLDHPYSGIGTYQSATCGVAYTLHVIASVHMDSELTADQPPDVLAYLGACDFYTVIGYAKIGESKQGITGVVQKIHGGPSSMLILGPIEGQVVSLVRAYGAELMDQYLAGLDGDQGDEDDDGIQIDVLGCGAVQAQIDALAAQLQALLEIQLGNAAALAQSVEQQYNTKVGVCNANKTAAVSAAQTIRDAAIANAKSIRNWKVTIATGTFIAAQVAANVALVKCLLAAAALAVPPTPINITASMAASLACYIAWSLIEYGALAAFTAEMTVIDLEYSSAVALANLQYDQDVLAAQSGYDQCISDADDWRHSELCDILCSLSSLVHTAIFAFKAAVSALVTNANPECHFTIPLQLDGITVDWPAPDDCNCAPLP